MGYTFFVIGERNYHQPLKMTDLEMSIRLANEIQGSVYNVVKGGMQKVYEHTEQYLLIN